MSRYIDADHLIKRATNPYGDCWSTTCEGTPDFVDYINEEPTVEVKPIVYGEWELVDDTFDEMKDYKCNLCGQLCAMSIYKMMNFCPNCGAKMRESEEEE